MSCKLTASKIVYGVEGVATGVRVRNKSRRAALLQRKAMQNLDGPAATGLKVCNAFRVCLQRDCESLKTSSISCVCGGQCLCMCNESTHTRAVFTKQGHRHATSVPESSFAFNSKYRSWVEELYVERAVVSCRNPERLLFL